MAIEIVDLPINSMVIFHRFLYVYQRVGQASVRLDLFSHVLQEALREFRGVHRLDDPHQTCDPKRPRWPPKNGALTG